MTRWILLLVFVFSALDASAQLTKEEQDREKKFQEKAGAPEDTTKPFGWANSVIAGANLTQASFTNWVQGGQNALSYTLWFNGATRAEPGTDQIGRTRSSLPSGRPAWGGRG